MKFRCLLSTYMLAASFIKAENTKTDDKIVEYFDNSTIYVLDDNGKVVMGAMDPKVELEMRILGFDEPTIDDINFYLNTNDDNFTKVYELFVNNSDNLKNSPFNPTYPTKILIHGFANTAHSPFSQQIKNTYLDNGKFNVIIVGWGDLAAAPFYLTASGNTLFVGNATAQLIQNLVEILKMKLNDLHIIGHSLGAHTAGIVGKQLKSGKIGRITGLDPALPLYSYNQTSYEWRLTKEDAHFVDVIHTSGGVLGVLLPLGDNDFYPNGGAPIQPGCGLDIGGSCSHSRSWEYFVETIPNAVAFPSIPCKNLEQVEDGDCQRKTRIHPSATLMGENAYKDTVNTIFYTKTRSEKPFAINGYVNTETV